MKKLLLIAIMFTVTGCGLISSTDNADIGNQSTSKKEQANELFDSALRYLPDYEGQAVDEVSDIYMINDDKLIEDVRTIYDIQVL